MPSESRELIFPLRGISEGWGFGRQPEGTCPEAQNVIPIDALGSRVRGGQRWGLSRYYAAQHNGANALQQITSVALSIAPEKLSETFTQGDGVLDDTNWYPCEITYPNANISGSYPPVLSNEIWMGEATCPGAECWTCAFHKNNLIQTANYEMSAKISWTTVEDGAYLYMGFILKSKTPSFPNFHMINFYCLTFKIKLVGTTFSYEIEWGGASDGWHEMTEGSGDWKDPAWWTADPHTLKVVVAGKNIYLYAENDLMDSHSVSFTGYTGNYIGFHLYKSDHISNVIEFDDFSFGDSSQSNRDFKLITTSEGDIYTGRPSRTLTLATDGENAVATSGRIGAQPAYGKTYFCDGTASGYKVLDNATDTVSDWTPTGGSLPVGTDDATKACRIITLYRGRIVMAGLQEFPHNWYMSKVNDPLDWDYGATTSAIMAVAGNNTDAGECPDIITCLASFSDDIMYIGGDHTLWVLRGDPADRGRIDNISEQIGIAGPDAFAFDPNGIFYFFGMGTVWKMTPDGIPEPISRNRLDATFGAIDLTANTVHLHWDNIRHGLFIFVVPSAEGSTTHYYWDQQSDSFWKIVFPNAMGPSTAYPYDGDNPNDNALLLGGWDGYIRYIDSSVKNDDDTKINSHILYPPMAFGGPERNTRINRLTTILDTNSDDVVLTAYAEDTVQQVVESSTIRFVHTLSGGRTNILKRIAGNAIMIKLANDTINETWAIENLIVNLEARGRVRKNQL